MHKIKYSLLCCIIYSLLCSVSYASIDKGSKVTAYCNPNGQATGYVRDWQRDDTGISMILAIDNGKEVVLSSKNCVIVEEDDNEAN